MNVRAMLEELERLGVEVRVVGDDLEYEGPEEVVTPKLLEKLRTHRADLMAACCEAETVAEEDRKSPELASKQAAPGPEARKLLAADWEPKVRCGKTIWLGPEGGFWYSQEMALRLLEKGGAV
jgi:TubC N-terminal docking domain